MPDILVEPRRKNEMELAIVSSGFVTALTNYFTWVKDKDHEQLKGKMSAHYFFTILEFNIFPSREPTSVELKNLNSLAKTVDGYRQSARGDLTTYDKFWNNMSDSAKTPLLRLNMTKDSPAVKYLKEAFNLTGVKTASPEQFTPQGLKNLENINVDISQSPKSNVYDVVTQFLELVDYDVGPMREDMTYADFIANEQLFGDPTAGGTQPPVIPTDPGDPRTDSTPPEIKAPETDLGGRVR